MDTIILGTVTTQYSDKGRVIFAEFSPSMKITAALDLMGQMEAIDPNGGPESLKRNAELTFASWFSKVNEIELADRDDWEVVSEIVHCEQWPSGSVRECVLVFKYQQRQGSFSE